MEPLSQSDVMHLQEPSPAALDLSMCCKESHLKPGSMGALDLVKKPNWYGFNPGSRGVPAGFPDSRSDRHIPQIPTEESYSEPDVRLSYGTRPPCVLSPQNLHPVQLPRLNGLPPAAQKLSQHSATYKYDPLVKGDRGTGAGNCFEVGPHFMQRSSTPSSTATPKTSEKSWILDGASCYSLVKPSPESRGISTESADVQRRGRGGGSVRNGVDCVWVPRSGERKPKGLNRSETYQCNSVLPVPRTKGIPMPQDSGNLCISATGEYTSSLEHSRSPDAASLSEIKNCFAAPRTPSSTSRQNVISENAPEALGWELVHEQSLVNSLTSEFTDTDVKSPCSPEYISSDDSDVIEVPVSNLHSKKSPSNCSLSGNTSADVTNHERRKTPCSRQEVGLKADDLASAPLVHERIDDVHHTNDLDSKTCLHKTESNKVHSKVKVHVSEGQARLNPTVTLTQLDLDSDTDVFCQKSALSTSDAEDARTKSLPSGASSTTLTSLSDTPAEGRLKTPQSRKKKFTKPKPKKKQSSAKQPRLSPGSAAAAAAAANVTHAAKRRRKEPRLSGSSFVFPPREPEIKLKYLNYKEEKSRDGNKADSFAPYVHVELREFSACAVVNFQDEDDARLKKGQQPSTAITGYVTGVVPKTSCLRLGRLTTESRGQATQACCLCGWSASVLGLGDLHGPYNPSEPKPAPRTPSNPPVAQRPEDRDGSDVDSVCSTEAGKPGGVAGDGAHGQRGGGPTAAVEPEQDSGRALDSGDCGVSLMAKKPRQDCTADDWRGPAAAPPGGSERWVHEDCSIWSTGVFLVKGRLYGLEEAVWLAQGIVCSACHRVGATLGCFFKGCPNKYHYPCALQSDCVLNEENFTIRCPKHKNKSSRIGVNRLNNR